MHTVSANAAEFFLLSDIELKVKVKMYALCVSASGVAARSPACSHSCSFEGVRERAAYHTVIDEPVRHAARYQNDLCELSVSCALWAEGVMILPPIVTAFQQFPSGE